MNIDEYKDKVIELFQHGNPSVERWEAMATAVLRFSEADLYGEDCAKRDAIDDEILGPRWDCSCGNTKNRGHYCECGEPRDLF